MTKKKSDGVSQIENDISRSAREMNELKTRLTEMKPEEFIRTLDTEAGRSKVALALEDEIETGILECTTSKIIKPQFLDPSTVGRSLTSDSPSLIVDVEPNNRALVQYPTNAMYVTAPRAEIPFFTIQTPEYEKFSEELYSYRDRSIFTMISNDYLRREIANRLDQYFFGLARQSTRSTGKIGYYSGNLSNDSLTLGFNKMEVGPSRCNTVLMSRIGFNQLAASGADAFGSSLAGDCAVNSYRYDTVLGRKLITDYNCEFLTANPYGGELTRGHSSNNYFDADHPVGSNIAGCFVNGKAEIGKYPTSEPLVNGKLTGSTSLRYGADELSKTTQDWAGNETFFFARENYLGRFYRLGRAHVGIRVWSRKITIVGWLDPIGLAILDIDSVSRTVKT